MENVYIAIKPKYPTRKAIDKVLFNEGNFLTIIKEESSRQISALLDTSFVSIINDGKYYPVDVENYEEQYNLVNEGSDPTVDEDENFGVKTLDYFMSATDTEGLDNVQTNVEVYNGIIRAKLFKVLNYNNIGIESIDKNGYWFVFKYDLTSATTEGYSDIKLFDDTEIVNGDNYVFLGYTEEDVSKYLFSIKSTLTINEESGDANVSVNCHFSTAIMNPKDSIPAIEIDGKEYDTLSSAFAVLANKGGLVKINKSVTDSTTDPIIIEDGKEYTLEFANGAVATINNYFHLKYGTFNFKGEGTIKEATPTYCIITLNNTDENKFATVNVSKGVTLRGWFGTIIKKDVVNTTFNCAGTIQSQNNGTDNGAAISVNGKANKATVNFSGSTEGSVGFGMYIAGNADVNINNAFVTGTDGGLEQRAGNLTINNSRITTTSEEEPNMVPSGNGTSSTGCAVAIAQHTTKKKINVTINNSTLIGPAAFMEGNPQSNPTATEDTIIKINNGSFMGLIKTLTPDKDCEKFLYGGVYTEKPNEKYIAEGFKAIPRGANFEIVPMTSDDYFVKKLNYQKLADYLYSADYPVCDYDAANKYFEKRGTMGPSACSSVQVGNIRGRNFDWYYNNSTTVVIKTPAENGRYASLSVSGGHTNFTNELLDSGKYDEMYRYLACATLDGINSEGLIVNSNVIPDDIDIPEHTKIGSKSICGMMVCRYLLDNAATVEEAITLLNNIDIWPYKSSKGFPIYVHWHISDAEGNSVIAEIIDGKIKITEDDAMTNFYNGIDMTLHANGIERYNIIKDGISSVTDTASMIELMKQIKFTEAYSDDHDIWYSEMNGKDRFGDLTINSKPEDYAEKFAFMKEMFANRSRDVGDTWQTCHTSVYDAANKTLTLLSQEEDTEYTFSLE